MHNRSYENELLCLHFTMNENTADRQISLFGEGLARTNPLTPEYKNIVQVKNANTKDNNYPGAEQPLTIDVRLERRPVKTCHKKPFGKKKTGNLGTFSMQALQRKDSR